MERAPYKRIHLVWLVLAASTITWYFSRRNRKTQTRFDLSLGLCFCLRRTSRHPDDSCTVLSSRWYGWWTNGKKDVHVLSYLETTRILCARVLLCKSIEKINTSRASRSIWPWRTNLDLPSGVSETRRGRMQLYLLRDESSWSWRRLKDEVQS